MRHSRLCIFHCRAHPSIEVPWWLGFSEVSNGIKTSIWRLAWGVYRLKSAVFAKQNTFCKVEYGKANIKIQLSMDENIRDLTADGI